MVSSIRNHELGKSTSDVQKQSTSPRKLIDQNSVQKSKTKSITNVINKLPIMKIDETYELEVIKFMY